MAVYDDGSKWCFGCSYYVPPQVSGFVKQAKEAKEEHSWSLPNDLTQDFPEEVVNYANKYSITVAELIANSYYFSQRTGKLWRLLDSGPAQFNGSGSRRSGSAAEARYCNGSNAGPKSLFFGSKEETFAIAGTERDSGHLVLTEDSFSSIKVGRVVHAMPLFGTSISMSKLTRLLHYQQITVWLDKDKFKEAWDIALKFKWLGIKTNVVLTPLDPKYYNEQEIMDFLK